MVIGWFPLRASADTLYEEDTFYYTIDNGEVTITRGDPDCPYLSGAINLVIPDEIEGYPVTAIADGAFSYWSALCSIVLPSTLKSIGNSAFKNCNNLAKIEIPSSIEEIDDFAFWNCDGLRYVAIGEVSEVKADHYVTLGDAFYDCEGFETLILGNIVKEWNINVTPRNLYQEIYVGKYVNLYASENMGMNETCIIYGYNGSKAETYANTYGLTFVSLDATRMELVSCNPEMGGVYSSLTDLELTFNIVPSKYLEGSIYIKDYDTDETVVTLDSSYYNNTLLTGTDNKTLRFKNALSGLTLGKYYILIDSTAITAQSINSEGVLLGYPGITKKNAYTFAISETEVSFPIRTSAKGGNDPVSVAVPWDDYWFTNDPTVYNHKLAIACSALAGASYDESYLTEAFQDLDFDTYQMYYYDDFDGEDYDIVSYGFAAKKLSGQDETLVAIIIRGTPGNEEWYSNFDIGSSSTHSGFNIAADRLLEDFETFYRATGLSSYETKILVTGHSRGAAVANIVAYDVINRYVKQENLYAYTFATPTVSTKAGNVDYPNIFNIISGEDFVTQVPLAAWGYGHYGTDLLLPSRTYYGAGYDNVYKKMSGLFKSYSGVDFNPYPAGSATVSSLVDYVYTLAEDNLDYDNKEYFVFGFDMLQTLHQFFNVVSDVLIDKDSATGIPIFDWFINQGNALGSYSNVVLKTLGPYAPITYFFVANHVLGNRIFSAHSPLTYYCWMASCTGEELFGNANQETSRTYSKLTVACPVDVYVYDESGALVASVIDEEPVEQTLAVSVEDGVKTIYLPSDQDYSVKVIAREDCTVDYTVEENTVTAISDAPQRTIDKQNISMKEGESLRADVDTSGSAAVKEFNLDQYASNGSYKAEIAVRAHGDNPFTDIKASDYYYQPIIWALDNGITTGTTDTTFAPKDTCTRAQVVTFLWRAAGEPEPTSTENPFSDVKESDYFYKAVLWAVENEITKGMDSTHFNPKQSCTRAQVVTFLYRYAGGPSVSGISNPFSDVEMGKWYSNAVLWAVGAGVTTGVTSTTFVPDGTCIRGQIVTFLYRISI